MSPNQLLAIFAALMIVLAVLAIAVDWLGKPLKNRRFIPRIYRYPDEKLVEFDPGRTAFSQGQLMLPAAPQPGLPYVDAQGVSSWAQSHFVFPDPEQPNQTWGQLTSENPTLDSVGFANLLGVDTYDTYERGLLGQETVPTPPPPPGFDDDELPPPPGTDGLTLPPPPESDIEGHDGAVVRSMAVDADGGPTTVPWSGTDMWDLDDDEDDAEPEEGELLPADVAGTEAPAEEPLEAELVETDPKPEPDPKVKRKDGEKGKAKGKGKGKVKGGGKDGERVKVKGGGKNNVGGKGTRKTVPPLPVDNEPVDVRASAPKASPAEASRPEPIDDAPIDVSSTTAEPIETEPVETDPTPLEPKPQPGQPLLSKPKRKQAVAGSGAFSALVDGAPAPNRLIVTPEQATSEPGVWKPGESLWAPTGRGTKPSPATVRRRFWQSAAVLIPGIRWYGVDNIERMIGGSPPRRRNRRTGKLETMQVSGLRASGDNTVSRPFWPGEEPDAFGDF